MVAARPTGVTFGDKYGPWAIVAGASEGTGRAFAHQLAAQGIHCILIARRPGPLEELAAQLRAQFGVQSIPAAIDLSSPTAFETIVEVVGSREVGLYVNNAGADPHASYFLSRPVQVWIELLNRNLLTTIKCCHHFGSLMRSRKRGGILLVGSGAGFGGAPFMAIYSGAKAFDLCFGQSLWAELRPDGVDVLCLVLSTTDTPALQRMLAERGTKRPSSLASPESVAKAGIRRLRYGPVYCPWGPFRRLRAAIVRTRVQVTAALSKSVFGESRE